MNNQEAIEIIRDIDKASRTFTKTEIQALEMAIKALEQEPCGDAISRQAVNTLIDELARAISDERCCISRGRSTATIMQDILDLPPVNSQDPSGDWISRVKHAIYKVCLCEGNKDIFTKILDEINKLSSVNPQEPKYCDRNICLKNEYNGIGCDECEVTKS